MRIGTMCWPYNMKAFPKLAELGTIWIRAELNWIHIQGGGADNWNWSYLDDFVNRMRHHNFNILGLLPTSCPYWASVAPSWHDEESRHSYPPKSLDPYMEYISRVVRRYKSAIRHWEIGNEPDHHAYWRPVPDPIMAGTLYNEAARAIRDIDPEAYLVSGGLSSVEAAGQTFYTQMGISEEFDAVALHCYRFKYRTPTRKSIEGIQAFKEITGDKPIWMTEVGWNLSERGQASQVVHTHRHLADLGVQAMFVYRAMPAPSGSHEPEYELLNEDLSERASFKAMKEIVS